MTSQKKVLLLYVFVAIIELLSIVTDWTHLRHFTKPLLMPILMTYVWIVVRNGAPYLMGALFFSWLGDVALMYDTLRSIYFIIGLSAFLISHILYIKCYVRGRNLMVERPHSTAVWIFSLLAVVSGTLLLLYLTPYLEDLLIPVYIYGIILTTMLIAAIHRSGKTNPSSFQLVVTGALFFMISDSLLAINKFAIPIYQSGILIMVTYLIAQLLIARGILTHYQKDLI